MFGRVYLVEIAVSELMASMVDLKIRRIDGGRLGYVGVRGHRLSIATSSFCEIQGCLSRRMLNTLYDGALVSHS